MILLANDIRQTLPVIPWSTAAADINACLKSSNLWSYVKTLKLKTNMWVVLQNDESTNVFSKQLLDISNGKIPVDTSINPISFPPNFCQFTTLKEKLITKVFPNIDANYKNHVWLSEWAISASKNKDVGNLNIKIQSQIAGQLH